MFKPWILSSIGPSIQVNRLLHLIRSTMMPGSIRFQTLRANADRVVWGDLDNDGDLDAVLSGIRGDSDQKYARVQENVNGDFVEKETPLPDVVSGNALLADYDNDNDLDILFQGQLEEIPGLLE